MKIRILGAGPAGLTFAALMKRHDPSHDVVVYERGPRDATWGFGVVFSDRALEFLRADDEDLYRLLTPHMETWPDLTIVHNDTRIPIAGNGFAAIGRLEMLGLLYAHAESLGVRIVFQTEISSLSRPELAGADLVVGGQRCVLVGARRERASFGTRIDWRPNQFIWYGTSKPFDSLSLTFRETPHGVFCAHHYRYRPDMSTFLVEVEHADLAARGLRADEPAGTIAHCEQVFARTSTATRSCPTTPTGAVPGDLERTLELRQRGADGRRAAHRALLDRLGHAAGDGGRGGAVQGLAGGAHGGRALAPLPGDAPAADEEDLGRRQRQPALVRADGPAHGARTRSSSPTAT
jgi:hypothetical protein